MGSNAHRTSSADAKGFLRSPTGGFDPSDFPLLADHLPHMIWFCRPDGTLDYMNSHGLAYFGDRLQHAVGLFPSGTLVHPDDREALRGAWNRALRIREELSLEVRLQRSDGAFRWHLVRGRPVRDDDGGILKWMGTSTSVHGVKEGSDLSAFLLELSTDFARMDDPHELLSTAMARLRQNLGAAQVSLAEFDPARGQVVMLRLQRADNPNLQVLMLPLAPFESLAEQARQGLVSVVREMTPDNPAASLVCRWYGCDDVGAYISAPLLQGGKLVASLSVVHDAPRNWTTPEIELTQRVVEIAWPALEKARSENALAISEQRLRLAQAAAQIGTWELNPAAGTMHLSAEGSDLFGLQDHPLEDLYRSWVSLIDTRDSHALAGLVAECDRVGTSEAEFRYRHPTRGLRWIHCRAGRVDEGMLKLIVGISLDVTERRKAEEALKDVNQRKDEFLAMLAHELRNPLAPIRNAAQILRAHSTGQPELDWARTIIERQTRHLVRLVDDLLDVSRMVRGKIVLKKSRVDIAEMVQHAVDTSQPLIRARRHQLHVGLPGAAVTIEGDLTRLAQAVANLLNNAAKYTDEGGEIWLDVWAEASGVMLRVRDTGPGISAMLLPHVFDLFTQAERTLDRAQGGLGIGLTLVKLLVEMHGGTVTARNLDAGHGAEFLVRLPAAADGAAGRGGANGNATGVAGRANVTVVRKPMKILVVDDNVDAADSIALLLTIDGFEAHSVHGAAAALDTVPAFKPDVVLLDIGLPVMDGYEVARKLRARVPADRMRIVALSGYGQQADRDRAAQAGFDDYLVKPVEPTALTEFLHSLH